MQPSEYFDAAKARLSVTSDYALCQKFGIPNAYMPGIKNGTRAVPLDVAYKLAITLELDPAQVVADLEQQREKNPQRLEFWKGFISRAVTVIMVLTCTLALNFSAICAPGASTLGGNFRRLNRA